ncbi:MAG: zincin-like metallopeptidase domain-containing protein [Cyanobacteria bacterium P01_A01_bin.83]
MNKSNANNFLLAKDKIVEIILEEEKSEKSIEWKRRWKTKKKFQSEFAKLIEKLNNKYNKPQKIFHIESVVKRYLIASNIEFDYQAISVPKFSYAHDRSDRSIDKLSMVKFESCHNNSAYYSTLFYELIHTTGVIQRLNRPSFQQGRSPKGANMKEEIIAELGAVFLSKYYRLENIDYENHARYIKSWLGKSLSIQDIDNVYDDVIEAVEYLLKYFRPINFQELISKPNFSWRDLLDYYNL